MLAEQVQHVEIAVGHLQVKVVHRGLEHVGVDVLEGAVAGVGDEVGGQALGHSLQAFDQHRQLFRADRHGGLVHLNDLAAGFDQGFNLAANHPRQRQAGGAAVGVMLVEGPVHDGVGAGEHALDRFLGEVLGELPPVHRHGAGPLDRAGDDGLVVVAVAVATHQPALLEAGQVFGEVGHHVAAVHLAVHQHVQAQLLLLFDPEGGGALFQLVQLIGGDLALAEVAAPLQQVVGLGEAAHRRDREERQVESELLEFFSAHCVTYFLSNARAPAGGASTWRRRGRGANTPGRRRVAGGRTRL